MSAEASIAMTGDQWNQALIDIGRELKQPANLCLLGSGPSMFKGQDGRLTIDLDTLRRRSRYDTADMQQACEKAGILLDPKSVEPSQPYIQVVDDDDGIVHVGKFKETLPVMKSGRLNVEQVPWANIIASKLVRGAARDIDDIMHILKTHPVTPADAMAVTRGFPGLVRENAEETLSYISLIQRSNAMIAKPPEVADALVNESSEELSASSL